MIRKPKGITAKLRASKKRRTKAIELENMRQVRSEDGYCRFPLCGCYQPQPHLWSIWLKPEVAHLDHRGMGGNPAGDKSDVKLLITVCNWRHKIDKFSLDKKTIKCEPMTDMGTRGPVRWLVNVEALRDVMPVGCASEWLVIAEEVRPHLTQPLSDCMPVLRYLREMAH